MPKERFETDERLREAGFDAARPAAEAIARLRELRATRRVEDGAIARALGNIATVEAAALLEEMERGASGAARREIRRALFKLRQRGIARATAAVASGRTVVIAETGLSGLLSPPDAVGARIVWLVKTGTGVRRLWGVVSDSAGLVAATLENLSRKEYREQRRQLEERAGAVLAEVEWRLADFILCEAWRATPAEGRGKVGDFLTLRTELIEEPPAATFTHPLYAEFADALDQEVSAELLQEPESGAFKLPEAAVHPYAEEIASLRQSVIVLNRLQQEERIRGVIERALEHLLVGANAERLRRRLEDTGYYFARTGRRSEAARAAAAAAALRDGRDLKRSGFFEAFMRAQLGAVLAEETAKERDEPRLIMTPAEMMRARQQAQARMGRNPR